MVAARAAEIYEAEARKRMQARKGDQPGASPENLPELQKGDSRDQAGKALGVSGKSVALSPPSFPPGQPQQSNLGVKNHQADT